MSKENVKCMAAAQKQSQNLLALLEASPWLVLIHKGGAPPGKPT